MTHAPIAAAPTAGRPRTWWVALLLNLVVPPAGYAYVGAWVPAAVTLAIVMIVPMALLEVTLLYPPGLYALGMDGLFTGGAIASLSLSGHAAWLAVRSPPKTGPRLRHAALYLATWVVAMGTNLLLRAYWPSPTYSVVSSSMAPNLQPEDVVAVEGARALCGHGDLRPGQVVVFRKPGAQVPYIHRIVAGPGQAVGLDRGILSIDGQPVRRQLRGPARTPDVPSPATVVEETLPDGAAYRTLDLGPDGALDTVARTTVPAGSWYLLGDNRDNSADSRVYGAVLAKDICAVGLKIVSSKDMTRVGQAL